MAVMMRMEFAFALLGVGFRHGEFSDGVGVIPPELLAQIILEVQVPAIGRRRICRCPESPGER